MRRFSISAAVLLILSACTSKNPGDTVIRFEVENMTASQVDVLLDRTTNYRVELDKEGKGELVLHGKGAIYPTIAYGQDGIPVFVGKGEEVTLEFDGMEFQKGISVEGKEPEASAYLQTMMLPEIMEYDKEFDDFQEVVSRGLAQSISYLENRGLEDSCPAFAGIEKKRLEYLFAQSYVMYPLGYGMMHEIENYKPGDEFYVQLKGYVREEPELADVDAYRAFMQFAVPMLMEHEGETFASVYDRTTATMLYIANGFKDQALKENLLRMLAIDYIQTSGSSRMTEKLQKIFRAHVFNPAYIEDFETVLEEYDPIATGKASPDFKAVDLKGKEFSLNDFVGKYLYIDLWATWCGPCRNELPHLKALEEKFAGKEINFLGLSIDQDKTEWGNAVRSGRLPGVQLWLGDKSSFLENYGVKGIPRFILLDKQGKIINANMLRPSSEDTEGLLNGLEGI